jgi:hypothetical protein
MSEKRKRYQLPTLDVKPEIKEVLKAEAKRQRRSQQEIRRMLLEYFLLGRGPDFPVPLGNGNHPTEAG